MTTESSGMTPRTAEPALMTRLEPMVAPGWIV